MLELSKVLHIDIDDVGKALFEEALAGGHLPSIKRLEHLARRYVNFWARDMCSPFRAGVMTGLDPHREGNMVGNIIRKEDNFELPTHGLLLPMGMPGYKTHRGKWHLSNDPMHPITCGFDEWSGSQSNLGPGNYTSWQRTSYSLIEGLVEDAWTEVHATDSVADDALADIEAGVGFVHVSFNAVHKPLEGTGTDNEKRLSMLSQLDGAIGNLVATALRANYVIFFMCDNGTVGEGKNTLTEAGICTPLWVWGSQVVAGESAALVQCTDLWATYRDLRGVNPTVGTLDSYSFVSELHNPGVFERSVLTCCDFENNGVIPASDLEMRRAVRNQDWKLYVNRQGVQFLYQLPDEDTNLIAAYPEIVAMLEPYLPTVEG